MPASGLPVDELFDPSSSALRESAFSERIRCEYKEYSDINIYSESRLNERTCVLAYERYLGNRNVLVTVLLDRIPVEIERLQKCNLKFSVL